MLKFCNLSVLIRILPAYGTSVLLNTLLGLTVSASYILPLVACWTPSTKKF